MKKIIILGMNRTGTKLASFLISNAFDLKRVYLEPFSWDRGIVTRPSEDWKIQQKLRERCQIGQREHKNLNVISSGNDESPWLNNLLNSPEWDIFKFIEIGRHDLYKKYNPDAYYISLIRNPIEFIQSIKGMKDARKAVVEQWERLHQDEGYSDPLPDADKIIGEELAACAKAYYVLYSTLSSFKPNQGIKITYEELKSESLPFSSLEQYLDKKMNHLSNRPMLGNSTKTELTPQEKKYIKGTLHPIYESFLEGN
ncbi:hypothetical protein NBRC116188_18670 [Oceaniserpentilla sp. 4NH20-0058]|uniref:hypothetical protein n=1 Tax=Oceaniserpentilla sp. 4NH20-0058 TaxID=3127660 RepID=UPI00310ABB4A